MAPPPLGTHRIRIGEYLVVRKNRPRRHGSGVRSRGSVSPPEGRAQGDPRDGHAAAGRAAAPSREAAIAAQLKHPNIVGVHEVGTVREVAGSVIHFIAMDLIDGTTPAGLERRGLAERLAMLEAVARAAGHAHQKGIVHRDLKPSTVIVDRAGRVFLTDFGLARAESIATKLTHSQAVMGTPHYLAPEQVAGRTSEIDARSDVYALGVMPFEIGTERWRISSEFSRNRRNSRWRAGCGPPYWWTPVAGRRPSPRSTWRSEERRDRALRTITGPPAWSVSRGTGRRSGTLRGRSNSIPDSGRRSWSGGNSAWRAASFPEPPRTSSGRSRRMRGSDARGSIS